VKRVECVVIGGGIAGSATAWWLSKLGHEVTLLEQFEPGHARGSSHGSVRIFRFVYRQADYIRLAVEALDLWREAEAESGETLLECTGGVDFGEERALHGLGAALEAEHVDFEWLDFAAASNRFPGLRFDGPALFQPQGGRCYAGRSVAAMRRMAAARGAILRFHEPALSVEVERGRARVTTAAEEFDADICVIAAGAWVERLAGTNFRLPRLAITREQPAYFRPHDPSTAWPSFIEHRGPSENDWGCYGLFSPADGLKVGIHMTGTAADPDSVGEGVDPTALAQLKKAVARAVPGVDAEPPAIERCLYTTTPSEDFVIERSGPLVVTSPCSGHGFKFGPAIGRMVAEFALGISEPPKRFRLP
jgi:sarcosine oxidase